ncbi:MAG: hypothetical protein HZA93_15410 [Verrucomicrobia bacterium]|nr:hypothetical protein [Verrucomicrobiota bacterium]
MHTIFHLASLRRTTVRHFAEAGRLSHVDEASRLVSPLRPLLFALLAARLVRGAPAPKGRKSIAQGSALGFGSNRLSSPERATPRRALGIRPLLALILASLAPLARAATADDTVMRAMRDELARSMSQLQLENLEKPYFIAYRVQDARSQGVAAQLGSALGRFDGRNRTVAIEVRVGSPAFDNTNFQSFGPGGSSSATLALDDHYDTLRRQLWLATDRAYKAAAEQFSRKKAALQNKTRTEVLPDFSPQAPVTLTDLHPGKPIDLDRAEAMVRELSAVFREPPLVDSSIVRLTAVEETTRYVNSEGSAFTRTEFQISVVAGAATQAPDGFPLDDHFITHARAWDALPPKAELAAALRQLTRRLAAQRDAQLLDQYNGPVLLEGQAAVEIFAQVIAPLLGARPRPIVDSGGRGGRGGFGPSGASENPFLDKLGARVLPDMFTVVDNPTLTTLNGQPLFGDARIDDEGVPTRAVTLVEKGRLRTLLTSRAPVRGVPRSTGSVRNGSVVPSNLIVSANDGLDAAALKAELLKLVEQRGKDYGVIIRRLGDPNLRAGPGLSGRTGARVEPVILAVKVFPDGREEPLRNVDIAGIEPPSFKDILVAGREPHLSTVPFRSSTCSFAVPSLLFEDLTLKKPAGEISRPPIAKHPLANR